MNWLYNGEEITDISQFSPDTFGFVYQVTTPDGRKYIGKKVLYHNQKKKLTKVELSEQTGRGGENLIKLSKKKVIGKNFDTNSSNLTFQNCSLKRTILITKI